jgi:hypoxanthine phosphoribosyltransferase
MHILFTETELRARVTALAREIAAATAGDLHVVGVLTGAFVFLADIIRQLDRPLTVDFVSASSYGRAMTSSGTVTWLKGISTPVTGRQVLLIDDIVDTGRTLAAIQHHLLSEGPRSLRTVCLLDKPSRREVPVLVDHVGFEIENRFVVGYGLDASGLHRNLPYLAALDDDSPRGA